MCDIDVFKTLQIFLENKNLELYLLIIVSLLTMGSGMLLLALSLFNAASAGRIIIANNTRITYNFGHEIQPYIANEIKIISDGVVTTFDANKFRVGARYKINDFVRIDPHLFIDNKRKDDWIFSTGPALRLDVTF